MTTPLRYYNDNEMNFCENDPIYKKVINLVLKKINITTQDPQICDYGCGNGHLWKRNDLTDAQNSIISKSSLSLYDPSIAKFGQEIIFGMRSNQIEITGEDVTLKDASYDCTVSTFVLVAIQDPVELEKTIQKIVKITKPNGHIIITITHPCFLNRKHVNYETSFYTQNINDYHLSEHKAFDNAVKVSYDMKPIDLTDYYRSTSYYINQFIQAGTSLDYIEEIYHDMEYPSYMMFCFKKEY